MTSIENRFANNLKQQITTAKSTARDLHYVMYVRILIRLLFLVLVADHWVCISIVQQCARE